MRRNHRLLCLVELREAIFIAIDQPKAVLCLLKPELYVSGVTGESIGAARYCTFEYVDQCIAQTIDVCLICHALRSPPVFLNTIPTLGLPWQKVPGQKTSSLLTSEVDRKAACGCVIVPENLS